MTCSNQLETFDAHDIRFRRRIASVCKTYLRGNWTRATAETIQIARITGGASSHVFRCSLAASNELSDIKQDTVLIRLYDCMPVALQDTGQMCKAFQSHSLLEDAIVFTILGERGLGPRLLALFPHGRVEQFIVSRHLTSAEMIRTDVISIVAGKLADIHRLDAPIAKTANWMELRSLEYVSQIEFLYKSASKIDDKWLPLLKIDWSEELQWVLQFMSIFGDDLVFCHNDLHVGNILLRRPDSQVDESLRLSPGDCTPSSLVVIDYEFASYNHRLFDLANCVNEWSYDYSYGQFPYFRRSLVDRDDLVLCEKQFLSSYTDKVGISTTATELRRQVVLFKLVPAFFWSVWSIVTGAAQELQNSANKIPFGYWEYANERLHDYYQLKDGADFHLRDRAHDD